MFTTTQIGAAALFLLSASKDVSALPLLATRQNSTSSIGNFGSCSVPQIQFAVGFDNRKETSFEPVDQTSYPHGSADNIDIITQFMCDQLTNACNADATAKATCATATQAADGQTAKTGAQADAFNAAFGVTTNFANVAVVNDQGVTQGVDGASSAAGTATAAAVTATDAAGAGAGTAAPCPTAVTVTVSAETAGATSASVGAAGTNSTADNSSTGATATASNSTATTGASSNSTTGTTTSTSTNSTTASSGVGNFGSCSVPQIQFGVGFDNRKETAFEPVDQVSYNHGSADNIAVITQFMCNTLTNTCNADATAKATCAQAQTAAQGATAPTGAQADAFNAVFGITTNFNAVPVVSNTGVTQSAVVASASSTAAA